MRHHRANPLLGDGALRFALAIARIRAKSARSLCRSKLQR
jgi:hypothetical protein